MTKPYKKQVVTLYPETINILYDVVRMMAEMYESLGSHGNAQYIREAMADSQIYLALTEAKRALSREIAGRK